MEWQLLITVGIVILAASYLVRQTYRSWSARKEGCGGSCGCNGKTQISNDGSLISSEQLLGRLKQSP